MKRMLKSKQENLHIIEIEIEVNSKEMTNNMNNKIILSNEFVNISRFEIITIYHII